MILPWSLQVGLEQMELLPEGYPHLIHQAHSPTSGSVEVLYQIDTYLYGEFRRTNWGKCYSNRKNDSLESDKLQRSGPALVNNGGVLLPKFLFILWSLLQFSTSRNLSVRVASLNPPSHTTHPPVPFGPDFKIPFALPSATPQGQACNSLWL